MAIFDRIQTLAHLVDLLRGALSYFPVVFIVLSCLILGTALFCVSHMEHHPNNRRYRLIALACPVVAAIAVALGMWAYSAELAEQARWSSQAPSIDWESGVSNAESCLAVAFHNLPR